MLYETTRRERTRQITTALRTCAAQLNPPIKVAAAGCEADEGEWLYDMLWWEESDDGRLYTRQLMVMECEWREGVPVAGVADVDGDFLKLIQARADVRVWISNAPTPDLAAAHIENCKEQIRAFSGTMPGDRYVLATLVWSNSKYTIKQFQAN